MWEVVWEGAKAIAWAVASAKVWEGLSAVVWARPWVDLSAEMLALVRLWVAVWAAAWGAALALVWAVA